jgi:hypothetical protein
MPGSIFESDKSNIPGLTAGSNLSTSPFRFVLVSGGNAQVNLGGNGTNAIGVLLNKPDIGEAATVAGAGSVAKVEASAAITAGTLLKSSASGVASGSPLSGQNLVGIALTSTTAGGQLLSVLLIHFGLAP